MGSKIEKLEEFNYFEGRDALTVALDNTIIKKVNEIIDVLNRPIIVNYPINSQAQPEIFKEFSDKNIRDDIPEGFVEINGKLHKMEDTPEEKEEWKKRYVKRFGYWGEEIKFIQQLLDEREREVLQEIIGMAKNMAKDYYSGNTRLYLDVRNVQDKLVKLNKEEK